MIRVIRGRASSRVRLGGRFFASEKTVRQGGPYEDTGEGEEHAVGYHAIVKRWAGRIFFFMSLVLFLASIGVWVRSYWVYDQFNYYLPRDSEGQQRYKMIGWSKGSLIFDRAKESGTVRANANQYVFDSYHSKPVDLSVWGKWSLRGYGIWFESYTTDEGIGWDHYYLVFPTWGFSISFGVVLSIGIMRRRSRRNAIRFGLCPTCGYDLRATPERCPECGRTAEVPAGP